jgi:hypothetical protein
MALSTDDLDYELARRKMFPPRLYPGISHEEFVTVDDLKAELDATPPDATNRGWLEFELALATRQEAVEPGKLFYRVVTMAPPDPDLY